MKTLTLLTAVAAFAASVPAMAQMSTDQHMMPNGNVHTTTTTETPMGTRSTTRVDRPDGSTRIVHRETTAMGDQDRWHDGDRGRMHDGDHGGHRGWRHHQVCRVTWHHGHRIRRCWSR